MSMWTRLEESNAAQQTWREIWLSYVKRRALSHEFEEDKPFSSIQLLAMFPTALKQAKQKILRRYGASVDEFSSEPTQLPLRVILFPFPAKFSHSGGIPSQSACIFPSYDCRHWYSLLPQENSPLNSILNLFKTLWYKSNRKWSSPARCTSASEVSDNIITIYTRSYNTTFERPNYR